MCPFTSCLPSATPGSAPSPSSSSFPPTFPRRFSDSTTVAFLLGLVVLEYILTYLGYEGAGDFTVTERLKTSIHVNLIFYLILGSFGLVVVLLIMMRKNWNEDLLGLAMACSNTFGLVTGAFLLGFGLSEIPKSICRNADWTLRQKVLSHNIAKTAIKLDDAHQELSNAIEVAQATSKQMAKRDPLRLFMNVIDHMIVQMMNEDPLFKPQGGQIGETDMDYDTDEKSMATLRRHLKGAQEEYNRCKSEYLTYVLEALELEDTVKNFEQRSATGWKFVSSFRSDRAGMLGPFFDAWEFVWRCILRKQLAKLYAVLLGCMSTAILLAEATLLPSGVDLSVFSILINSVATNEMAVQVSTFVPLMFMCICTYYSLFKVGMLMFYSFTRGQTSSVSLLMICSMVARYAPPVSYNFLNLIRLDHNKKTIFEKKMGNIDNAVPFFGKGFNKIYPVIMVLYTILVATNFFDRIINALGSWKIFLVQKEAYIDGFDPSGLLILQKERTWLEQGRGVGKHLIPLARDFNGLSIDLEAGDTRMGRDVVDMKATARLVDEHSKVGSSSRPPREEGRRYSGIKETMTNKHATMKAEQRRQASAIKPEPDLASAKVSLLHGSESETRSFSGDESSTLISAWASFKSSFETLGQKW